MALNVLRMFAKTKKQGNANLKPRWGLLGTLFKLRSPLREQHFLNKCTAPT